MDAIMLLPLLAQAVPDSAEATARRRFPAAPTSAGEARRFVVSSVELDDPDLRSRLATLASELATNAIRHAHTPFTVLVAVDGQTVRVSVSDGSPNAPTRRQHAPEEPTGRGLVVVEALADRWGFQLDRFGKTVWFEIDLT